MEIVTVVDKTVDVVCTEGFLDCMDEVLKTLEANGKIAFKLVGDKNATCFMLVVTFVDNETAENFAKYVKKLVKLLGSLKQRKFCK